MTAQIIFKRCKCEIIRNCGCIDDLTDTQNFDFSIIPDVIVVDLVWLNHDARHVSTKWIGVIFSDLIHALSADHWESCFNLGLVALLQVLLRKNYGLICDCLDLSGELLDARLRFLQGFV